MSKGFALDLIALVPGKDERETIIFRFQPSNTSSQILYNI